MSITLSDEYGKVKILFHGFGVQKGFSRYVKQENVMQAVAHYFGTKEHNPKICELCEQNRDK